MRVSGLLGRQARPTRILGRATARPCGKRSGGKVCTFQPTRLGSGRVCVHSVHCMAEMRGSQHEEYTHVLTLGKGTKDEGALGARQGRAGSIVTLDARMVAAVAGFGRRRGQTVVTDRRAQGEASW